MVDQLILHIGTMKSGTSYLQSVLAAEQAHLARSGVTLVDGPRRGDTHKAVLELLNRQEGYQPALWPHLLEQLRHCTTPTAVVSSEFFSFLRPDAISELLRTVPASEIVVVVGVRDQLGAIPAQWQSYARNRGRGSFAAFVREIAEVEDGDAARGRGTQAQRKFHRAQDVVAILDRWQVPAVDRVAAVVVPRSAPSDELWRRFATATGLPADVDVAAAPENQSLGYASCDYLRRLNAHVTEMPVKHYRRVVRRMTNRALVPLRKEQPRPQLDRATAHYAGRRNGAIRAALRDLSDAGGLVVGSMGDLPDRVVEDDYESAVAPPRHDDVVASARAGYRWAAQRAEQHADADLVEPADLDALVTESARLLALRPGGGTRGRG